MAVIRLFYFFKPSGAETRLLFLPLDVCLYIWVASQACVGYTGGEYHTLECLASAESHVDLSGREGCSGIYDHVVECESLAFMDGYGPGEAQGELRESALHLGLDGICSLVYGIFRVFPDFRLYRYRFSLPRAEHFYCSAVGIDHMAYLAVEVAHGTCGIVLYEHYLCAGSQFKGQRGGI